MLYVVVALYVLDIRIDDAVFVLEKRRQPSARDIAVFVDGRCQYRTPMCSIPAWIIGAPAEEGNAKGSARYDHNVYQSPRILRLRRMLDMSSTFFLSCGPNRRSTSCKYAGLVKYLRQASSLNSRTCLALKCLVGSGWHS